MNVSVFKRPGVEQFIKSVSNLFELVLFTASTKDYATAIIERIDPIGRIQHKLFREHCTFYGSFPIKSLSQLGRDLKNVIIVDDMSIAYSKDPNNGVPITSWKGDKEDNQLQELLPVLELLAKVDDVRIHLKRLNRGNRIDYKKAATILNQEIANNRNLVEIKNSSPYGLSKYTSERANEGKEQVLKLNTARPLLRNYSAYRQPLHVSKTNNGQSISANNTNMERVVMYKQPVTIMNKAYELANTRVNKNYYTNTPRVIISSKGNDYGVCKVTTYVNF